MTLEDENLKITLEKVNALQIEESLKTITSSVIIANKTNKDVFVTLKYHWDSDAVESKISSSNSNNLKISSEIPMGIPNEEMYIDVEVKLKDEVILNHSFGIESEINE